MKKMLKAIEDIMGDESFHVKLEPAMTTHRQAVEITYEDANVVRYIAGYVCWKVLKNIEVSSRSNKQQLLSCVEGLLGDDNERTFC